MKIYLTQLRSINTTFGATADWLLRTIDKCRFSVSRDDIMLLPELVGGECGQDEYVKLTADLGRQIGCYVVAGSHHDRVGTHLRNRGAVANPDGAIIARYEKQRPYGIESQLGVVPGSSMGTFDVAGLRVLVMICADFWYSAVLLGHLAPRPDIILVPTLSISRRPSPEVARSLWKSMAVARAYEFGVYVGISDWAYPAEYHGLRASSVAGFADPRASIRGGFFSSLGKRAIAHYDVHLNRLRALREHRSAHAFLSDETLSGIR
jgi:predicted amidohydrolase